MLSPIPSVSLFDPDDADALVCQQYLQFMEQLSPCSSVPTVFSCSNSDDEVDDESDEYSPVQTYDPETGAAGSKQISNQLFKPETLTNDFTDDEGDDDDVELTLVNATTSAKSLVKMTHIVRFANNALRKLESTGDCPAITADTVTANHLVIYVFAHFCVLAPLQTASYINHIRLLHLGKSFSINSMADLTLPSPCLASLNLRHSPCFHFLVCLPDRALAMSPENLVLQTMMTEGPLKESSVTYSDAIVKKLRRLRKKMSIKDLRLTPANTAERREKELERKRRVRQSVAFFVHGVM